MVDLGRDVEVAVVDEAQMLQDEQRGWAWTLAIAAVRAKRVIMCGSEDGLAPARRLADRLGIPLSVRRFERKNPLQGRRCDRALEFAAGRCGRGVFAQRRRGSAAAHSPQWAQHRGDLRLALPAVRRREAERFRTGRADVLVATDAIGLGLNLPIRRLVFATLEKFDGVTTRLLKPPEIRQIAGRAGRYGLHEEGQVSAIEARDVRLLRERLGRFDDAPVETPIWISPTDEHLRRLSGILGTNQAARLLEFFQTRVRAEDSDLRIADLSETIEVAVALEMSDRFLELPLEVRCTYGRAPVSTRGPALSVLAQWGELHAMGETVDAADVLRGTEARDRLLLFEDRSKLATLYLWLAQRFPRVYVDGPAVMAMRQRIDDDIHDALLRHGDRTKKASRAPVPFRRKGPPKFDKRKLKR